jgi:hypothetical protein
MAGRTTGARRVPVVVAVRCALGLVALALVALGTAACGGDDPDPSAPGASPDSQIGGAPSGGATPPPAAGTPTPTPGPDGGSGGGGGTSYPRNARPYAQHLLQAWGARDDDRIAQLTNDAARQQIKDSVDTGGVPNTQWTHIRCGPSTTATGYTDCLFRNAHGDEAQITLNNARLGQPTAVTVAGLQRTEYPSAPVQYVTALLMAKEEGNQQRVLRLSNGTVASQLRCTLSGGRQGGVEFIDGNHMKVTMTGLGPDLGRSYEFKVLTLPQGRAHAVKAILSENC